jgi:hypothetical protein
MGVTIRERRHFRNRFRCAECDFETKGGQPFYLTAQLRMAEAGKK